MKCPCNQIEGEVTWSPSPSVIDNYTGPTTDTRATGEYRRPWFSIRCLQMQKLQNINSNFSPDVWSNLGFAVYNSSELKLFCFRKVRNPLNWNLFNTHKEHKSVDHKISESYQACPFVYIPVFHQWFSQKWNEVQCAVNVLNVCKRADGLCFIVFE